MRWPHESAIVRRDEHLARTRRLTIWIAGGAATASVGLAAALGSALPGHSVSAASQPATSATPATQGGSGAGSGQGGTSGDRTNNGSQKSGIAPPPQAPAHTSAPPVVSSGGS